MKKVFFSLVAASVLVLSACNNKPAEDAAATATEATEAVTETAAEAVATIDSTADAAVAAIDSTVKK